MTEQLIWTATVGTFSLTLIYGATLQHTEDLSAMAAGSYHSKPLLNAGSAEHKASATLTTASAIVSFYIELKALFLVMGIRMEF